MPTKTKLVVGFVAAALLVALGVWWFQPSDNNRIAKVSWRAGGEAMTGVFTVVDTSDRPLVGARVQGWNSSGYSQGITDTNGIARIQFGEPELSAIDVDGKRVLDRMGTFDRTPYVVKGLYVQIRLK